MALSQKIHRNALWAFMKKIGNANKETKHLHRDTDEKLRVTILC